LIITICAHQHWAAKENFAVNDLDLDITSAKIQTLGPAAVDSFYVRDSTGSKILDQGYLEEIKRALLFAIDGSDIG
jgi:UTP:GlnB (protein PII) uridylyltransferase